MTDTPILDRLEHEAEHLRDEAEQEARRLVHGVSDRFRHHGYPDRNSALNVPERPPMSSILATFKADVEEFGKAIVENATTDYNRGKEFLEQKLPAVAGFLDKAAANPAVDAVLSAVHVSPAYLQAVAEMISKADADIAALQSVAPAPAEGDTAPAGDGTEAPADPAQGPAA